MDISASEWSSGCESGWTVYFDESSQSPYQGSARSNLDNHQTYKANADNEEDLSMVSDASSGPPHFQYGIGEEDEVECNGEPRLYYPSSSSSSDKSKKKKKAKEPRTRNQHSFLDDTASSPAFNCPNKSTDPSNNQPSKDHLFGFSQENGFKGKSAFGFWQSSNPRQQDSTEPSRSRGRRRG